MSRKSALLLPGRHIARWGWGLTPGHAALFTAPPGYAHSISKPWGDPPTTISASLRLSRRLTGPAAPAASLPQRLWDAAAGLAIT